MTQHLDAQEAHTRFDQLLDEIPASGQAVIVERSGLPLVAILPFAQYQQLISDREIRSEILDDIRRRMPYLPTNDPTSALLEDEQALRAMYAELEKAEQQSAQAGLAHDAQTPHHEASPD